MTEIPIANKDINEYSQISSDDIDYITIPSTDIPKGSVFYNNKIDNNLPTPTTKPLAKGTYLYPLPTTNALDFTSEDYITFELSGELEGPFISSIKVIAAHDNYLYLEVLKDNNLDSRRDDL